MPRGLNCRSTSGSVDRSTSGSSPPVAWGTGAMPLAWPPSTATAAWLAILVFGCELLLLLYVAARQLARAAGSYHCAARKPARAVRPTTRVAGFAALAAVAGLAALAAGAGLAALAAWRAAPPAPTQTRNHRVRNLAVSHLMVVHPHLSNAVAPQPVCEHEDTGWLRAEKHGPASRLSPHRRGSQTPTS